MKTYLKFTALLFLLRLLFLTEEEEEEEEGLFGSAADDPPKPITIEDCNCGAQSPDLAFPAEKVLER